MAVSLATGGVVTADLLLEPLPTELRQAIFRSGAALTWPGALAGVPPASGQDAISVGGNSSMDSVASSGLASTASSASTIVTRPALSSCSLSSLPELPKNGMLLQAVRAMNAVAVAVSLSGRESLIGRSPRYRQFQRALRPQLVSQCRLRPLLQLARAGSQQGRSRRGASRLRAQPHQSGDG